MIVSATVTYDSSEEEDVRCVGRRLQDIAGLDPTAPLVGRRLQEIAGLDPTAPLVGR